MKARTRRVDLRSLGPQVLAATAVLLVAAVILMSVSVSQLKDSLNESKAAEDTLLEITTIETRLVDLDGTVSNLILTDGAWYRKHLDDDKKELRAALQKLRHSLRNDSAQLRKHAALDSLLARHDTLEAGFRAPQPRNQIEKSQTALRQMTDRIRNVLWEILISERTKRLSNHATMIAEAERSLWIAVGIVFLTFAFGAVCVMLAMPRK